MKRLKRHLLRYLSRILKIDINYFVKNGLWVYGSYIISLITGIILTYTYGNFLSKEIFGQFNFVLSILSLIGIFSLPGMGQALTYAFSKNNQGNFLKAIKQTFWFSLIGSLILFFLLTYYLKENIDISKSLLLLVFLFPLI